MRITVHPSHGVLAQSVPEMEQKAAYTPKSLDWPSPNFCSFFVTRRGHLNIPIERRSQFGTRTRDSSDSCPRLLDFESRENRDPATAASVVPARRDSFGLARDDKSEKVVLRLRWQQSPRLLKVSSLAKRGIWVLRPLPAQIVEVGIDGFDQRYLLRPRKPFELLLILDGVADIEELGNVNQAEEPVLAV